MLSGVVFGFSAALLQSVCYLCSRLFIKRHNNDIVRLLALSHIIMGVISVPLAVILLPENMPAVSSYVVSLVVTTVFYLLGQFFLFAAIIKSEPSRVAPLLGLKIFIVAVASAVFFKESFGPAKWLAVLLSITSVFLLSNSGKKLELKCIILVIMACLAYSVSDFNIKILIDKLSFMGVLRGASLSGCLSYILCGGFGLIILFFAPGKSTKDTWLYSMPFAVFWLIGVFFMFASFGLLGVVFGNILQSARGLLSIVLGVFVAYAGFDALEPKITKKILIQRMLAAVLMAGAVTLFLL